MIIGLGHKARQGKDTVANYLVEKYSFTRIGFADAVKEEYRMGENEIPKYFQKWLNNNCYNYFNKNIEGLTESYPYIYNDTPTKDPIFLQWWEEFRRKQDPDYWVKKMQDKIACLEMANWLSANRVGYKDPSEVITNIVIPDVRYKNEAQFIKDLGGQVWDVRRFSICKECDIDGIFHYNNIYGIPETEACPFCKRTKKCYYESPDRPADHPSEIDLDDYKFDNIIEAESGDTNGIEKQVDKLRR